MTKVYPRVPVEFFNRLNDYFHFTVDVAAEDYNAVLPRYYTPEIDGLAQDWSGERVWCNPPYDDLTPWLEKAEQEVKAELIVMMLPAHRTDEEWWHKHIEAHRDQGGRLSTRFLAGRMRPAGPSGRLKADLPPNVLAIWE